MRTLSRLGLAVAAVWLTCGIAQNINAQTNLGAPRLNVDINATPWFSNPRIRQQMKLDENQFNRLNSGYNQYWNQYNQNLNTLDKNLTPTQRQQRINELQGTFYNDFDKTRDSIITDPSLRQRYNQLHWQYQGYRALDNPIVREQLQLTNEQRQALQRYNNEANEELRSFRNEYGTNRDSAAKRFSEWRKQSQERINSTLTPQQRKTWNGMIGDQFEFNADDYIGGTVGHKVINP